MSASLRLLPFRVADGPWNMAADEALLHAAAAARRASLRFYGWSSATLSLGYFQSSAPALALPALASLPWVRRPTGGSALVHHLELTYALALPRGLPWQAGGPQCATCLHAMLRNVLAGWGIAATLCTEEGRLGEVLCFLHHTPSDVLVGGAKVAGSAQRKQRGAVLQHGGILLARSPFTPELPGLWDLSGASFTAEALQAALVEEFRRWTGWAVEPEDWSSADEQAAAALVPRYSSAGWNARR
jgi:lipoate-protein ligase A